MTDGQLAEQYALMWFRDVLVPWAQGYESKQCQPPHPDGVTDAEAHTPASVQRTSE